MSNAPLLPGIGITHEKTSFNFLNGSQKMVCSTSLITPEDKQWLRSLLSKCVKGGNRKRYLVEMTPGRAAALFSCNHENIRKFSVERARKIADVIREGGDINNNTSIALNDEGKIVDGQTRLGAIVIYGAPVSVYVEVNLNLTAALKKTLNRGKNFTAGDAASSIGHTDVNNLAAVAKRLWAVKVAVASHNGVMQRNATSLVPSEDALYAVMFMDIPPNHPHLSNCMTFRGKMGRRGWKAATSIAAAYLVAAQVNSEKAFDFFNRLANNELGMKGDPIHSFVQAMESAKGSNSTQALEVFCIRAVLKAFSVYLAGRSMSRLSVSDDYAFEPDVQNSVREAFEFDIL